MLRSFGLSASKLLAPQPDAVAELRAALDDSWRAAALELLAGGWRDQVTAAAAIALTASDGFDPPMTDARLTDAQLTDAQLADALWRAIDGASWVAPQLVAAALLADPRFEPRAAERLTSPVRRPPKTIGALMRAYNRCAPRRMPVVAQLGVHDRTLATEEARIGVRGVDAWLDYFGTGASGPISRSS
ncbi:MAG TPA: hypothetical protein VF334_03845 [Polyangia bacterium]